MRKLRILHCRMRLIIHGLALVTHCERTGETNVSNALPLVTNCERTGETNVSNEMTKMPLITNCERTGETNCRLKLKSDEVPHVAHSSWTGDTKRPWKNIELHVDGTELTDCLMTKDEHLFSLRQTSLSTEKRGKKNENESRT